MSETVRVRGTQDPADIAAVLAALAARDMNDKRRNGYDAWRSGRIRALRASRFVGNRSRNIPQNQGNPR